MIKLKRIYDPASPTDGSRFLVDRLWPRGVKKEDAQLDRWLKDIAPSDELRNWYHHEPDKWDEFCRRYFSELDAQPYAWQPLLTAARQGDVTLLYSARDVEHNNALALKRYLDQWLGQAG